MIRILTILLLPFLFIATSCDSGGEGTACAVDPTGGVWRYTALDIEYSDECSCDGVEDCNDLGLAADVLTNLECITISIIGGSMQWDYLDCAVCDRTAGDHQENINYSCSGNILSSSAGTWLVNGNVAIASDIQTVEALMADACIIESDLDFGFGCIVTTIATLTNTSE